MSVSVRHDSSFRKKSDSSYFTTNVAKVLEMAKAFSMIIWFFHLNSMKSQSSTSAAVNMKVNFHG